MSSTVSRRTNSKLSSQRGSTVIVESFGKRRSGWLCLRTRAGTSRSLFEPTN